MDLNTSVAVASKCQAEGLTVVGDVVDVIAWVDIRGCFNIGVKYITFGGVIISWNLRLVPWRRELQVRIIPVGITAAFVLSLQCRHCGFIEVENVIIGFHEWICSES